MSRHTTFGIGGPADMLMVPDGRAALISSLEWLRKNGQPYFIMGNGSNLVVSDSGLRMVVLKLCGGLDGIEGDGCTITAESGVRLSSLAVYACGRGLAGLEFAHGIPGALGGAVVMNAGAYDGEMRDVVLRTEYVDAGGRLSALEGEQHGFAYRRSAFKRDDVLLSSTLRLHEGDGARIRERMDELMRRRREKQPLDLPSAGSAFKRPQGHFAGKLIDDCGLRGFSIGGAQVSEKHCGFIVNRGGATCDDVRRLTEHIKEAVARRFGVELECEIRFVG